MAYENKTAETEVDVLDFLNSFVSSEQKKKDALELIKIMRDVSGFDPKMWGPTIIGFGSYHYKYATGHEGDAPLIGFSPRKATLSLYVHSPTQKTDELLQQLGTFKISKVCIYVKKLSDIDVSILKAICTESIDYLKHRY